ncbi:MAG TPA: hypothetical protein VG323_22835 [Thermoanaerobaculia bacterium]|nr:hypothetical protein [Thermoanaerobaculia bacterium]
MIRIDAGTAVIVCAGPSLERLTPRAWQELSRAGAVVGVNGAPAARACSGVPFTHLAAMDLTTGLAADVPELTAIWRDTPAWRVASTESVGIDAESYIFEVNGEHGIDGWADDCNQGYKGGSTGMIVANWLGNDWPDDEAARAELRRIGERTHKAVPRRGYRKFAYVGLDMHRDDGAHAAGAGNHCSGFARNDYYWRTTCQGWAKFCAAALRRGVEVVNLTPGTGLESMPRAEVPAEWLR